MSTWTINVYYSTAASFPASQSASQSSLFRAQCLAILAHDMAVVLILILIKPIYR